MKQKSIIIHSRNYTFLIDKKYDKMEKHNHYFFKLKNQSSGKIDFYSSEVIIPKELEKKQIEFEKLVNDSIHSGKYKLSCIKEKYHYQIEIIWKIQYLKKPFVFKADFVQISNFEGLLDILPIEIFYSILVYLQPLEIINVALGNKFFLKICTNGILWKLICDRDFGEIKENNNQIHALEYDERNTNLRDFDWMGMYFYRKSDYFEKTPTEYKKVLVNLYMTKRIHHLKKNIDSIPEKCFSTINRNEYPLITMEALINTTKNSYKLSITKFNYSITELNEIIKKIRGRKKSKLNLMNNFLLNEPKNIIKELFNSQKIDFSLLEASKFNKKGKRIYSIKQGNIIKAQIISNILGTSYRFFEGEVIKKESKESFNELLKNANQIGYASFSSTLLFNEEQFIGKRKCKIIIPKRMRNGKFQVLPFGKKKINKIKDKKENLLIFNSSDARSYYISKINVKKSDSNLFFYRDLKKDKKSDVPVLQIMSIEKEKKAGELEKRKSQKYRIDYSKPLDGLTSFCVAISSIDRKYDIRMYQVI